MRSIYKYILNFIIILLYSSLHLYAYQETFKSLSVSEGMTDLVVNSIYKDSRGFIWFGTNSSLEKFDGIRLKRYDIDAPANKKRVYVLTEDASYGILCGTDRGIYKLDIKGDKFVPLFQDVIDCRVNAIYRFSKDKLLVATEKGLYVCTDNSVVKSALYEAFPLPQNNVTGIAPASDLLSVWLSTMDGVVQYYPSANEVKRYRCNDSGLSDSFYNIVSIGNYLYLGTMDSGLMRFDVVNHKYSSYVDVGCSVISSLSCDGNDMLYVGTDGNGVHFVSVKDSSVVKSYRHIPNRKGGIRSNSIYSVLVDRDGLIWVGLYQMGVDYTLYQSGLFEVYQWKDRFTTKDMSVRTISFNGNQRLIGSRDGLVFIDEDRDIVKSYNIPELRSNMIISSCYYDGRFYIGTYGGGMYVLNPETLVISDFTSDKPFVNGHIFCIRPDYEGNLWIGTSSGLYCFNNGKQIYHFVSSRSKIPDGNVYEIFFDSLHRGWICTETGICLWEPSIKAIRNDVFPDGFVNSEKVRSICETSSGELYFLPEKGKIFRTDIAIGEFSFLENAKIFDDKQFLSLVEDGLGGMFITTNNGLYRSDSCKNIIPYNFTDGIPDPIFTNCVSVKDSSGVFWFGNSKGLVCLKPEKINKLRKNNYKIEITDILINGRKVEGRLLKNSDNIYELHVDGSNNNMSVLFSGMIYTDPSYMIYEYSIDDSKEWIPLHGISEISLYDVSKDMILKIRRAGYPESQVLLHVNVASNTIMFFISICVIVLCCVFIYVYRKWVIIYTVGNLKRFIIWLQSKINKDESIINDADFISDDNGTAHEDGDLDDTDSLTDSSEDKYRNYKLSDEECKRLIKILDKEMSKNKLYTNPSLKIADLADVAKTSSHALSYVFNQYLQKSYYDYINEFRVEEFKTAIQNDKYSKYTLEALSEHCGFSSRASFFRSFKKVTGITPNEYIKNIKASEKAQK